MTDPTSNNDQPPKVSPADRKLYEQEYKKGAALFQQALDQYSQSTNIYQKEEFKEVMNKAMDVLNDAASALKRQQLLDQNQKIADDFAAFQKKEDSAAQAKLKSDLDQAKKSV